MQDILFLAHRVPYPPDRGDKIRSWHILKALCGMVRVHVIALCDDARDKAHLDVLKSVAASVAVFDRKPSRAGAMMSALLHGGPASVHAFASPALKQHVLSLLERKTIGCVYAFSGQMAQYVPQTMDARFVMDFVDMDSAKYGQWAHAGGLKGLANGFEARRLQAFEIATAQRADVSLFISEAEADLFRSVSGLGADKVQVLESGIDLVRFAPDAVAGEHDPNLIVFTGQMDYEPNVEAVTDFVRDVWPLVREALPDAKFAIVGRNPVAAVTALAALAGVEVTGEVPDTRVWLKRAALVVAPLKLARGVQNKVLEAMAMGKAVVASSGALTGIDAQIGRDLIMADGADMTVHRLITLLQNPADAARLGAAARARMEARYGWEAQLRRLPELVGAH